EASPRNNRVWTRVSGGRDQRDSDGNAAKTTSSGIDATVGASFGFDDGWFAGGLVRYASQDVGVASRGGFKADISSFSGGVYGGRAWSAGPGTLRTTLAGVYTHHDVDSRRRVLGDRLKADYGADSVQVLGEVAWRLQVSEALMLEPFAGASWNRTHSEGFRESRGVAALNSRSWTSDAGTTTVGARLDARVHENVALKFDAGWEYNFGDLDPTSRLAFASGSDPYTVWGVRADRHVAVVGVGAEVKLADDWSLGVMYDGAYGSE
ncbi:autotransporter outer membrane beta-barrel domain-containing protein, partial [Phaeovibrio sulfidiphilus]